MQLLNTVETNKSLFELQSNNKKLEMIISPFINHRKFLNGISKDTCIVTRFNINVFYKRSSDFVLLKELHKKGIKIYALNELHSKIFLFDDCLITGSSNLTFSGLYKNVETNIFMTRNDSEFNSFISKIHNDFNLSKLKLVTDANIKNIETELAKHPCVPEENPVIDIVDKFRTKLTNKIITNPYIDVNTIQVLYGKCFSSNERFFELGQQILKELKDDNYNQISNDSYRRLAHWIHPDFGDSNPLKTASTPAAIFCKELLGYIPLRKKVPNYDYYNQNDEIKLKDYHELEMKKIFIKEDNSFANVWMRILEREGEQFYLTDGVSTFRYKIEDQKYFIPLRPKTAPKVSKQKIEEAFRLWPVEGPGVFNSKGIMAPSYVFGVFNDIRILGK